MSDNLNNTLRAALQKLALQQTTETLGDRTTYIGASDIAACPRKTIMSRIMPGEPDLATLLRFRRGHMAEDIVAAAFNAAGFTNFERQVEVVHKGEVPLKAHIDFVFTSEATRTKAILEVKAPETLPDQPYGSWEMQLYLQMGILAVNSPGYRVEKGAILALNFGHEGLELYNIHTAGLHPGWIVEPGAGFVERLPEAAGRRRNRAGHRGDSTVRLLRAYSHLSQVRRRRGAGTG